MNKTKNLRRKLTAVFERAPEGGYTCGFEEFSDVFSEGETIEKATANLMDILQLPSGRSGKEENSVRCARRKWNQPVRNLERHLTEYGRHFEREGGNHTLWKNPAVGKVAPGLAIAKSKKRR